MPMGAIVENLNVVEKQSQQNNLENRTFQDTIPVPTSNKKSSKYQSLEEYYEKVKAYNNKIEALKTKLKANDSIKAGSTSTFKKKKALNQWYSADSILKSKNIDKNQKVEKDKSILSEKQKHKNEVERRRLEQLAFEEKNKIRLERKLLVVEPVMYEKEIRTVPRVPGMMPKEKRSVQQYDKDSLDAKNKRLVDEQNAQKVKEKREVSKFSKDLTKESRIVDKDVDKNSREINSNDSLNEAVAINLKNKNSQKIAAKKVKKKREIDSQEINLKTKNARLIVQNKRSVDSSIEIPEDTKNSGQMRQMETEVLSVEKLVLDKSEARNVLLDQPKLAINVFEIDELQDQKIKTKIVLDEEDSKTKEKIVLPKLNEERDLNFNLDAEERVVSIDNLHLKIDILEKIKMKIETQHKYILTRTAEDLNNDQAEIHNKDPKEPSMDDLLTMLGFIEKIDELEDIKLKMSNDVAYFKAREEYKTNPLQYQKKLDRQQKINDVKTEKDNDLINKINALEERKFEIISNHTYFFNRERGKN